MGKVYRLLLTAISISALLTQCKRDFDTPNRPEYDKGTSYKEIFESFWNGVNHNYAMWAIDSTDWDGVYDKYRPLFEKLDTDSTAGGDKTANRYMQEMLSSLVDGHLWLTGDSSLYWPLKERLEKRSDYHDSIPLVHFQEIIPSQYLESGSLSGFEKQDPNNPSSFDNILVVSGIIKNTSILYLYFSSFQLYDHFTSADTNRIKPVLEHYFEQLNNRSNTVDGLIIDVRRNGGGSSADLDLLIGRLTKEKYIFGYTRYKNGNGRLDYGPWFPSYVNPIKASVAFDKPIVLLCDVHSGSMSEATSLAVKAFPTGKGIIIGERTSGRYAGLPENDIETGAGSFKFGAGKYSLSLSGSLFKAVDNNFYEGKGTPPDILVPYDSIALKEGRDIQLESVITYFGHSK